MILLPRSVFTGNIIYSLKEDRTIVKDYTEIHLGKLKTDFKTDANPGLVLFCFEQSGPVLLLLSD